MFFTGETAHVFGHEYWLVIAVIAPSGARIFGDSCTIFKSSGLSHVLLPPGRAEHAAAAEEAPGPGADHRGLRRDNRPAVAAVPTAAGDGTPRLVRVRQHTEKISTFSYVISAPRNSGLSEAECKQF